MSADLTGRVVAVNTVPLGDVLALDAPAGSASITLDDVAEFAESGGTLVFVETGEVLDFSAADDETGVVTLVGTTANAYFADDPVALWDRDENAPFPETVAQVDSEGEEQSGDPLDAIVDHDLIAYLPEGIREPGRGEIVTLEYRGDDLYAVNIIGKAPRFDASILDPETNEALIRVIDTEAGVQEVAGSVVEANGQILLAQEAAEEAREKADQALDDAYTAAQAAGVADGKAQTAQNTADGKNKVTYSTSEPGSAPNTAGDIWWKFTGALVTGHWRGLGGTSWESKAIDGAVLSNLDAGSITAGILNAARIGARSVSLDKITVGDFTNAFENPGFESGGIEPHVRASSNSPVVPDPGVGRSGDYAARVTLPNGLTSTATSLLFLNGSPTDSTRNLTVTVGDWVYAEAWVKAGTGAPEISLYGSERNAVGGSLITRSGAWSTPTGTWQKITSTFQVTNPTVRYVFFYLVGRNASAGDFFLVDDVAARRRFEGSLVVDGSITSDSLATNSVYARHVKSGEIQTDALAAFAVTGAKVEANTLTAEHMAVGIGPNAIANASLEQTVDGAPHYFAPGTGPGRVSTHRSGQYSMQFTSPATPTTTTNPVVFNGPIATAKVHPRVKVGDRWVGEIWARTVSGAPKFRAALYVANAAGSIVQSVGGTTVTLTTAFQRLPVEIDITHADASHVVLVLQAMTGNTAGSVLIDDPSLRQMVDGSLIVNGAIDGKTITGATVQGGIVRTAPTGLRVELSSVPNAFESGNDWGLVAFKPSDAFASWSDGLIWANYQAGAPGKANLRLSSPYPGTDWGKAAVLSLETNANGSSRMDLISDSFYFGSGGTQVDFNLAFTNQFSFRNPGGDRFNIGFQSGYVNLVSRAANATLSNIQFEAKDTFHVANSITFNPTGTSTNLVIQKAGNHGLPMLVTTNLASGFAFETGGGIRCTNAGGEAYIDIKAAKFTVSSDGRFKDALDPVTGALDAVSAMQVYDYDTTQGAPEGCTVRGRGVVADELAELVPDLVTADPEDGSGRTVDLYGLLGTTIAAVQELTHRVNELSKETA